MAEHLFGSTARWTAAVRAKESARDDCLFSDPWAATLADQEGAEWIEQRPADSVIPIVLRTRFFDDFLQRITTQNAIRQIVLVAAGLDTRAFRLGWPDQTRIYELDQSSVLKYKEQILRSAGAVPTCARQTIEADLADPWQEALIARQVQRAGSTLNRDPSRRSCPKSGKTKPQLRPRRAHARRNCKGSTTSTRVEFIWHSKLQKIARLAEPLIGLSCSISCVLRNV